MHQNADCTEMEVKQTESLTTATEESSLLHKTDQNADCTELEVKQTESLTKATEESSLLHKTDQNADCTELEVKQTESLTKATEDLGPVFETHQNADSIELEVKQMESPTKAQEVSSLLHETHQIADCTELEVMEIESSIQATEDLGPFLETHKNAYCTELEVKQTESPTAATEDSNLLYRTSLHAYCTELEVMEAEFLTMATKDSSPPLESHQYADCTELEVKQMESPTKATLDLSLLHKTYQNADCTELEIKQMESPTKATADSNLLHEMQQNADCTEIDVKEMESPTAATGDVKMLHVTHKSADCTELEVMETKSPTWAMEDSDLQPEFSSSDDDNEIDPDFDFEKELKIFRLKRCKKENLELSSTSSSDEENDPDLSSDSEEVFKKSELKRKEDFSSDSEEEVIKKSTLKRKKLKLSEKITVKGNGICISKTVNEDHREVISRLSQCNMTFPDCCEEELINDSDESDISVVWPMLSKPSVGSTTIVEQSDSEENDSVIDEDSITRDKEHKGIYVTRVLKSRVTKNGRVKKSDRVYNSRHPCPFCTKWQTNFSHHILSKQHAEEPEVLEIMKLESSSKERKRLINILRLRGEHQHNVQVIKEKQGEMLLARRSVSHSFCIDDYTPCPNCLEWIRISVIKRHQPHCPARTDFTVSKGSLIIQSKIITGKIDENASKSLVGEVFPIMIEDGVGKVAKTDPLIINLGNQWMQRNVGNRIMRKYYTSSIMRLAGRLLINARQMTKDDSISMDSLLQPKYFDIVAQAALKCSKQDESDEEDLQSPSNAVKLGFDIKRMASAKLAMALIGDDQGKKDEAKAFLTLLKIKWGLQVTKLARMVLSEKNFNKPTQLPLPEDVKKLATFMTESLTNADTTDESYENFRQIAQLVLARLTLYNRRRCHEVQALRLESYQARKKDADEIAVEMVGELTTFERELLKRQEVIEIRGKTGRGVPVILPQDVKKAMAYLADENVRRKAGIQSCSPYLFANSKAGVFRAYDAIKTVAEAAKLRNPCKIRTSNMRKYMATMLQSLDTTENERQWVIDHLGHTMKIHLNYYRQTSDILERVEIAKLLLIQDMGLVSQYRGKQLKDIQISDILGVKETEEEEEEEMPENFEGPVELPMEENIPNLFDLEEDDEKDEDEDKENLAGRKIMKKRKCQRQRWTSAEEGELKKLFTTFLERDKCPGQKDVEKAMTLSKKNSGLIHLRPRDNIKKKISCMLVKARKSRKK